MALPNPDVNPVSTATATKSGNYTATNADVTIFVSTTGGAVTIKMPAAPVNGKLVNVKKITSDANTITVDGNGNNVEGAATQATTAALISWQMQFDGSVWWVI